MPININLPKQIVPGPDGLRLELDASQIFPDDPGEGTPRLVCHRKGATASFDCACGEGELDCGEFPLNKAQCAWLHSLCEQADAWLDHHCALAK